MYTYTYAFWFYEELQGKIGVVPRDNSNDAYIQLEDSNGNPFDVKVSSVRLQLFRQNPNCVKCGREGHIWALEADRPDAIPHLNLYHFQATPIEKEWRKLCKEGMILMTKDHIIPKSKGGPTDLKNLQTMCSICNVAKGNSLEGDKYTFADVMEKMGTVSLQDKITYASGGDPLFI